MTARITKLLLLFSGLLLSLSLAAQYPNNPIKSRLGWQTTGDGLVYRGAGAPAYSPGTLFNAWMYLDTTNYTLYMYRNFQWTKLPLVNNGLTLDGSYVQLGGTLVENTTVERSTYTLDFGKKSGSNNGWLSFYGTDPHYVGILTTKDGTESGLTIGNKVFGFEIDDSDHVFSLAGTRFGFSATYLGTLGVSQFKMDSTRFYIRGLPSYSTHAAADADIDSYGMYQITDGRAMYSRTGAADKVSPNLFDNNTYAGVISRPWKFGEWTTAGRPTGVNGYTGFNTSFNWLDIYSSSGWFSPARAATTGGAFTAGYIPFGGTGGLTENAGITYSSSLSRLTLKGADISGSSYPIQILNNSSTNLFQISNVGTIDTRGHSTNNVSYNAYSGSEYRYRLYSGGNINNPLTFYVTGGARGSAYGELFLNNDYDSNAFVGGGINFDTRTGVAPIRFFAKNNSANPVDAMDVFANATIGIGTLNTAVAGAQLAINSTTRGFLPPRQTNAQRTAISSPPTGLQAFQTDATEGYYVKYASAWKKFLVEGDAATTWLKTELEVGRDVTINGASSTDFRIQNSMIQFDGTVKIGADSLIKFNTTTDTSQIKSDLKIIGSSSSQALITIGSVNRSTNFKTQISIGDASKSRGWQLGVDALEAGANHLYFYNNATGALPLALFGKTVLVGNFDLTIPSGLNPDMHVRATVADGFTVSNAGLTRRWINTGSNLRGLKVGGITSFSKDVNVDTLYNYGTVRFDTYGTGTKEASDLIKTESVYTAIYATDGTLLEKRANTEQYNTITSTTSPVTLSNTVSDNLINQGSTQATFTLNFPASPVDGQVLKITYNNAISTLTLDGNGNTIVGSAVTTGVAGSQRAFKFYTGIGWIKLY